MSNKHEGNSSLAGIARPALIGASLAMALCASAHAAGSSVQMYGTVDLGVEHFDNGAGSTTQMGNGVLNPSVIGFRGNENLGGGTSAFFHLETSFCANGVQASATTSSQQFCGPGFMGRTSIVGLRGDWGKLEMGRMFTLSNGDFYAIDPLHNDSISPFGNTNVAPIGEPVWDSQAIAYYSPSFDGFSVAGLYQFGGGLGLRQTTGGYNLHAGYGSGPLYVGADYEIQYSAPGVTSLKHSMIVASYDFHVVTLGAYLARNRPDAASGNPALDAEALTASVPLGNWTLIGEYAQQSDKSVSLPTTRQYNLGLTYSLSKNTSLYALYARTTNYNTFTNIVDAFGNNGAPITTGSGAASSALAVGMSMNF